MWTPPPGVRERTETGRYLRWLEERRGLAFAGYEQLWRWSLATSTPAEHPEDARRLPRDGKPRRA